MPYKKGLGVIDNKVSMGTHNMALLGTASVYYPLPFSQNLKVGTLVFSKDMAVLQVPNMLVLSSVW